jgi:hypothetical protein
MWRKEVFPPLLELLFQLSLTMGLVINILLCIHLNTLEMGPVYWIIGNIPIILLFLIALTENHKKVQHYLASKNYKAPGAVGRFATYMFQLPMLYRYPIFTLLLVPLLMALSLFLLLFGQQPDSLLLAFTQTYKHGFSEIDHLCNNVQCGGHFLCSVGANGHKTVVHPIRYGERNGHPIICTRQLLISNAFEELVQQKAPRLHGVIRSNYNRVGDAIHQHYHIFEIKWVSDLIYVLMKPLEWFFLLVLYAFDRSPENRIHSQYLKASHRKIWLIQQTSN